MLKKVAIIISPNWHDYAEKYLPQCADSIEQQRVEAQLKIFAMDNESTDASYAYLQSLLPKAEILRYSDNKGFAKPNNEAMKKAIKQGYDYVILINIDAFFAPGCIAELLKQAEVYPQAAAVQPRIMLWPDKDKINSLGNVTHFLGFGYSGHYQETYQPMKPKAINYFSGAAVLIKVEALKKVGFFDEEMWMYNEDQDLGWRFWLAGYQCMLAPEAVAYHNYSFSKSIKKFYWMDRNRIIASIRNYHWLTLLLILPAAIIMEFGLILFALKGGWLKEKIRVYAYFLQPQSWSYLKKVRKESQAVRAVPDRKIVKAWNGKILFQEVDNILLRLGNIFFELYWAIVKLLIFW